MDDGLNGSGRVTVDRIGALTLWAVYDGPSDYPDSWVARRWDGDQPQPDVIVSRSLYAVRHQIREMGFECCLGVSVVQVGHSEGEGSRVYEVWV